MDLADIVISSPLCYAAREGNVDAVKKLLAKGHNPCLNDNRGWTPMHEAVSRGHIDCVRLFLEHEGCNINARTFDGTTSLFLACSQQNNVDLVKLLLDFDAKCNIGTLEEVTPLHVACKNYKFEIIKVLLAHGADVNVQDFNGFTPLLEAIDQVPAANTKDRSSCLDVISYLLNSGADISLCDEYGRRPFFLAVSKNWEECITLILERGANINHCTADGTTALLMAAQCNNLHMVKVLLDLGANPEIACDSGTMPLHHALHNGYISIAEELLKKMKLKKILGKKNKKIESFLILAIDSSCYESYRLVMKYKIYSDSDRVNVSSSDRLRLLLRICYLHYQHLSPISFLLFHHLEHLHSLQMLKDLLSTGVYGANSKNEDDLPPLVALITSSANDSDRTKHIKNECFNILLENGAKIDFWSDNFWVPDCVMAVLLPDTCATEQSLLVPVLARCFSRTWDELLEWLVKMHTVRIHVIKVLLQLSSKTECELQRMLHSLKKCSCNICASEFPKIHEIIDQKTFSLKSLCRIQVRHWLWQQSRNRNMRVENVLDKLTVPREIKEFIVPVNL